MVVQRPVEKYFSTTSGIFLVFDMTKESTFENLEKWLKIIEDEDPSRMIVGLLGHIDHNDSPRVISREQAEKFASEHPRIKFYTEVSTIEENASSAKAAMMSLFDEIFKVYDFVGEQLEVKTESESSHCIIE
jgi:Ras-related protein Rab-11A